MPTPQPWLLGLVTTLDAAGASVVRQAMAEVSWLGRAALLTSLDTVLALRWRFELWSCTVVVSRRPSAFGRTRAAPSTGLLPVLAFACNVLLTGRALSVG